MNADLMLAKTLGAASVALGAVQLVAPRLMRNRLGMSLPTGLVATLGANRMASGFSVLAHPDEAGPVAARAAGGGLDLILLCGTLLTGNRRARPAVLLAITVAAGLSALDAAALAALRKRQARVATTARRTRVKAIAQAEDSKRALAIGNGAIV